MPFVQKVKDERRQRDLIVAVINRPRNCIWKMLKNEQKMFNNSAVYQYFRYCATKLLLLLLNYHDDVLS